MKLLLFQLHLLTFQRPNTITFILVFKQNKSFDVASALRVYFNFHFVFKRRQIKCSGGFDQRETLPPSQQNAFQVKSKKFFLFVFSMRYVYSCGAMFALRR